MGILAELGAAGLNIALRNKDPDTIRGVNMAYGLGAALGVILPFSRTQESEADRIGLVYMAKAGYDPREALYLWERIESEKRNRLRPPEFLSTHPSYGTRIKQIKAWLPEAMEYYAASQKTPNRMLPSIRADLDTLDYSAANWHK